MECWRKQWEELRIHSTFHQRKRRKKEWSDQASQIHKEDHIAYVAEQWLLNSTDIVRNAEQS